MRECLFRKLQKSRSEPAELRRLRKQVTEEKEGPLELRRQESKSNALGGRAGDVTGISSKAA